MDRWHGLRWAELWTGGTVGGGAELWTGGTVGGGAELSTGGTV